MTKESKTLQTLLVEKTGKAEEDVRQQLQELKQKIEKTAEAGDSFTIDGFGTFSGGDGALHFEPSGRLETEINQTYAGMQPIELVEAFKDTGAGVPIEPIIQESTQEEAPAQEPLPEPEDEPDKAKPKDEQPSDAPPEETEEPPVPADNEQEDSEKITAAPETRKKQPLPSRRKNGRGTWVTAAAVLIVAILVAGWLFFSHRIFPGNEESHIEASQPVDSATITGLPANKGDDSTETQNLQLPAANKSAAQKTGQTDSSAITYGLHGKVNQQLKDAYTIVIHSFKLKSTVQEIAKKMNQKGYRTVIFSHKNNRDVHWRVGLGQFKTIEAAQKAIKELPERYQKEKAHFIHRINSQTS